MNQTKKNDVLMMNSLTSSFSSSSTTISATTVTLSNQRSLPRSKLSSLSSTVFPVPSIPFAPSRTATKGDLVSVAPMMEWTNVHYRNMVRLLSKRIRLYTEMVVANTLIYSKNRPYYLHFESVEHPIAIQLGGNEPESLAKCAAFAEEVGYDEINLNCGCPSSRVSVKGAFGASLMFQPELVRDCVRAMRQVLKKPTTIITVKCRLGADNMDSYEEFRNFVKIVSEGGCNHFIIHARKCILKGLDPHGNRTIPPLRYTWVQQIALEFPHIRFSINGGFTTWEQTEQLLSLRRTNDKYNDNTIDKQYNPYPLTILTRKQKTAEEKKKAEEDGNMGNGTSTSTVTPSSTAPTEASLAKVTTSIITDDSCNICTDFPETNTETESKVFSSSTATRKHSISSTTSSQVSESSIGKDGESFSRIFTKFQQLKLKNERTSSLTSRFPQEQFLDPASVTHVPPNVSLYGDNEAVIDSVMIGRAAYNNVWMLADTDRRIFGVPNPGFSRREVIEKYLEYVERVQSTVPPEDTNFTLFRPFEYVKPLFGLFAYEYGARQFRHAISVAIEQRKPIAKVVREAMKFIPDTVLDERPPV